MFPVNYHAFIFIQIILIDLTSYDIDIWDILICDCYDYVKHIGLPLCMCMCMKWAISIKHDLTEYAASSALPPGARPLSTERTMRTMVGDTQTASGPPLVGATGHSDKGQYTGASTAPPGGVLRHLPDRLGSCPRGCRHQWPLARTMVDAAHQSPGTESNISGSSMLPVSSEEPPCPGENRQHSGCGVCQQAGVLGSPRLCRLVRMMWE